MKKNWVLRLGLLAMVLTLVTMPMVSSTYAKYVTADNGTAEARVAKWGVEIETDFSELFGDAYAVTSNNILLQADATNLTAATLSVVAATPEDLVLAPGTEGSFTFSITGTPEVAVNLEVVADIAMNGWFVDTDIAYQPVNFYFYNGSTYYNPETGWGAGEIVYMTAAEVVTAIETLNKSSINALTDLAKITNDSASGTYIVGWEWPFQWATGYEEWPTAVDAVDAMVDVTDYFVEDSGNPGTYIAATNPYNPAETYYANSEGTVALTYSTLELIASYNAADTALGDLATPTIAISLSITATQIN